MGDQAKPGKCDGANERRSRARRPLSYLIAQHNSTLVARGLSKLLCLNDLAPPHLTLTAHFQYCLMVMYVSLGSFSTETLPPSPD